MHSLRRSIVLLATVTVCILFFLINPTFRRINCLNVAPHDHHDKKLRERGMFKEFQERLDIDKARQAYLKERFEQGKFLRNIHRPPKGEFTAENPLTILFWHGGMRWWELKFDEDLEWVAGAKVPCKITYDREKTMDSHIILFLEYVDKEVVDKLADWQAVALLTLEPGLASPTIRDELKDVDILISYNQYSEVRIDYTYAIYWGQDDKQNVTSALTNNGLLHRMPDLKEKRTDALGCFFISNCGAHDSALRMEYLRKLFQYIPMHSYGGCIHTEGLEKSAPKIETQGKYWFTFAFENSMMDDYVTEKFYEGIRSDAIPIYLGAPNIHEYLPNKTAKVMLNVLEYPDPADLASYLIHLASHEDEYLEYFKWRNYPLEESFHSQFNFNHRGVEGFPVRTAHWYLEHLVQ